MFPVRVKRALEHDSTKFRSNVYKLNLTDRKSPLSIEIAHSTFAFLNDDESASLNDGKAYLDDDQSLSVGHRLNLNWIVISTPQAIYKCHNHWYGWGLRLSPHEGSYWEYRRGGIVYHRVPLKQRRES